MRVRSAEPTPPLWPVELLRKLGKYVYQTKSGFQPGHRLDSRGPITGGNPPTALVALAFATDPLFEPIETPLGRVEFITAVGITADELARMKATTTETVLADLRTRSPRLETDPARTN
jgi:Suppressor of fused protein (SUFU)